MRPQTNMLNLFVEFVLVQVFNIKTLFYFELRICAGMIENLKTRNITLSYPYKPLEALRCLKCGNVCPKRDAH